MRLELGRLGVVWAVVLAFGTGACGESSEDGDADDGDDTVGPSGVPSSKYLDELSPAELEQLCPWWVAAYGGPGEKSCDGFSVSVQTVEECVVLESYPHCSVSIFEDCMQGLAGDACLLFDSPACDAYTQCAYGL